MPTPFCILKVIHRFHSVHSVPYIKTFRSLGFLSHFCAAYINLTLEFIFTELYCLLEFTLGELEGLSVSVLTLLNSSVYSQCRPGSVPFLSTRGTVVCKETL